MMHAQTEDHRQLAYLTTPLGQPGSGRLRYAAAMYLYGQGQLSPAALECYRIASANDRSDPAALLIERGLPLPIPITLPAAQIITTLIDEADRYLTPLPGPGIAEVRSGLAQWRGGGFTPRNPQPNQVVETHLPAALETLHSTHPALAAAIAASVPHLDWITFDDYPVEDIGAGFLTGNAYAIIVGQDGPVKAGDFDLGLFLIAPHTLYRDHQHKAPELYAPLTGPHGWRFAPNTPLTLKPAHAPVWNLPNAPHLTKVGPVPFLCLYGWTRDVNDPARVIMADDWSALEALRLGSEA